MVLLDRYIDYGMDHHNIRLRKPGSKQDISQVLNYNAQEGDRLLFSWRGVFVRHPNQIVCQSNSRCIMWTKENP